MYTYFQFSMFSGKIIDKIDNRLICFRFDLPEGC